MSVEVAFWSAAVALLAGAAFWSAGAVAGAAVLEAAAFWSAGAVVVAGAAVLEAAAFWSVELGVCAGGFTGALALSPCEGA